MTMKRDHAKVVAGWLNDLAVLTAGLLPVADAKAKAAAMSNLLMDDFPDDAAFNRESLKACAEDQKFFPSYAEVKSKLGDWWSKHRPTSIWALPAPLEDAPLSSEGKRWAAHFLRRTEEGATDSQLATVLHMIRGMDDGGAAAYEWLIWKNSAAAAVARTRKLPTEASIESFERGAAADWQDPRKIQAAVDALLLDPGSRGAACLSLLRFAVGKHAPDNLGLIPERLPSIIPPRVPPFEEQMEAMRAAPQLRVATLTAEQLAEVRKNPTGGPVVSKSGVQW